MNPTAQDRTFLRSYLIGAAIIWTAIFLSTAVVLAGSPAYGHILPILSGGAVWFVVIIPAAWSRRA
jgi:hypothetical protein